MATTIPMEAAKHVLGVGKDLIAAIITGVRSVTTPTVRRTPMASLATSRMATPTSTSTTGSTSPGKYSILPAVAPSAVCPPHLSDGSLQWANTRRAAIGIGKDCNSTVRTQKVEALYQATLGSYVIYVTLTGKMPNTTTPLF